MDNKKIGKLIAEIRKEKRLTQQQLGDLVGVGSKAVSKWERGLTAPDISIINDVSKVLEITTDELLTGKRNIEKSKNKKKFSLGIIITLAIIVIIGIISLIIIAYSNKTHVYNLASADDEYYIEGTATLKGQNITIVVNKLKFLDEEFNKEIITNYEYKVESNGEYLFRFGYNVLQSELSIEQSIKKFAKEFRINYNGKIDISKTKIVKNNMVLTFGFINKDGNEIVKEINLKLLTQNKPNDEENNNPT